MKIIKKQFVNTNECNYYVTKKLGKKHSFTKVSLINAIISWNGWLGQNTWFKLGLSKLKRR